VITAAPVAPTKPSYDAPAPFAATTEAPAPALATNAIYSSAEGKAASFAAIVFAFLAI
jgi:hypothetical protein